MDKLQNVKVIKDSKKGMENFEMRKIFQNSYLHSSSKYAFINTTLYYFHHIFIHIVCFIFNHQIGMNK